jgi:hypothetical protein
MSTITYIIQLEKDEHPEVREGANARNESPEERC